MSADLVPDQAASPTSRAPKTSTTETGAPAPSDQFSLSVGADGPLLLHDFHFVNQMAHFDRERVPERVVHAKGGGAFGTFTTTEDVSRYTRAALFQPGVETDMLARFSTVAGEQGSADTARDPRGFSLKFYTTEGNYDLVGNNTPIFFVRDPMKFPHFIRSQKRLPATGLQDWDMRWDYWTLQPESAHQVAYLMGDRGIPKSWRHMNGYGSHTFMWVNAEGERSWVKYHFLSDQGVENLSNADGAALAGSDPDAHRRDLSTAIEAGEFPSWTLHVQVMPYEDAKTYRVNPFDLTKVWSRADYPLIKVGTMELNKNPENYFAQIEQAAFEPSALVPGIGLSPDKMLLGRIFSYPDTHRHRIGANYHQLPVNRPRVEVNTYEFDGPMAIHWNTDQPAYSPNTVGGAVVRTDEFADQNWELDGQMVRSAYTLRPEDDDWSQADALVRDVMDDDARDRMAETIASTLGTVRDATRERVFDYWRNVDKSLGDAVAEKFGAVPASDGPPPTGEPIPAELVPEVATP